jgi:hypothetical protein
MNALDISERFFRMHGDRMINTKFPRLQHRMAVGLVGEGSECFGFDDEILRDRYWGPGFCIWLESDDYKAVGPALQAEYERLPKRSDNLEPPASTRGKTGVGVFEIGEFYRRFIGLTCVPDDPLKWFYIPEPNLAACTNGKIFFDPPGRFSAIRQGLLAFFPEQVRFAKMALRCAAAHICQDSIPGLIKQNQPAEAEYAATKYASEIISLVFLINRRFRPSYQWSLRAMRSLRIKGDFFYSGISEMNAEPHLGKKMDLIEQMSSAVIRTLKWLKLSTVDSDYLLDHSNAIAEKISAKTIRDRVDPLIVG